MKIVYYSDPSLTDTDFSLVKAFQEGGHDVHFFLKIAPYMLRRAVVDIERQIPRNDIFPATEYEELRKFSQFMDMSQVFVVNKVHKKDVHPQTLWLYEKLCRRISAINPDMIICTNPLGFATSLFWRFRSKLVFIIHDPFPHTGENGRRRDFFRDLCFRYGKRFVLLNANQVEEFSSTYHISREQICVGRLAPYGVYKAFIPNKQPAASPSKNVLFFGRISPYKGVEYLCQAMEEVHRQIPDATLTIAGNGKMYFDIEPYKQLDYVSVHNRFITTEEMAQLFNECTFSCCPYTDATQSGVVMTSFAFEKPVIATAVGGLGEQVDDGVTGILVPPKDSHALADTIIRLLSNADLYETLRTNIRTKYLSDASEYSWAAVARKMVDFGKEINA